MGDPAWSNTQEWAKYEADQTEISREITNSSSEKPKPASKILIATTGQIPTINLEDLSTVELLKQ